MLYRESVWNLIVISASKVGSLSTHDSVSELLVGRLRLPLLICINTGINKWLRIGLTDYRRLLGHKPSSNISFEISL